MDEYYRGDGVPPGVVDCGQWRDAMGALRAHHRHPDRPQWCGAAYCNDTGTYPCWSARHALMCLENLLPPSSRLAFRDWADTHAAAVAVRDGGRDG